MSENKNEELAKSVVGFLDKYGAKLWDGVKSTYGKAKDESTLNWRLGYENYLDNVFQKYSYAKPFLSGNFPRFLDDFYIPLAVSCGMDIIEETSIEDLTLTNKFAIIVANAGSGKTMLMRHLFVNTIKNKEVSHIPVFVELRELNSIDLSLFDLIKKRLRDNKFDFDDRYIEKAFEAGHFAFFFDGFDEVAFDKREITNQQIQELADKFSKNYFVMSSRPDDNLNRWTLFDVWQVKSLNLTQACGLVEKTTEEEELKEKFVKALQVGLFESHKSFLSNPLLLSIMLITYKDSANIPQKLSTFYERAYIALFERHDATKNLSREKRSKLDIQDFKKFFSAFCFITYRREKYGDFTETEVYDYFEKTIKLVEIKIEKKYFLDDLIQAVCLLVRDGLNITFSHRSFQEYFASVFITSVSDENKRNLLLKKLLMQSHRKKRFLVSEDDFQQTPFWKSLYELSPAIYEKLIINLISEIEEQISYKGEFGEEQHYLLFKKLYESFSIYLEPDEMEEMLFFTNKAESDVDALQNFIIESPIFMKTNITPYNKEKGQQLIEEIKKKFGRAENINIETLFENRNFYQMFEETGGWLTKNFFYNIFELKKSLVEKFKKQDTLLDDDLF